MRLLPSGAMVVLVLLVTRPLSVSAAPCPLVPSASVLVDSDDSVDRVSVSAQAVPLRLLISAVACLAGLRVTNEVRTERAVSVEFERLPLDRALRQLLARESFIFVYDRPAEGRSAKLRRIILLEPSSPRQRDSSAESAVGPAGDAVLVLADEAPPHVVPEDGQAFNPAGPLQDLLLLVEHHDPRMRKAALEALTLHDGDDHARRTLMDHIRDPDPNIRLNVVGLLGPFVTQWPGAEDVVMTALRDPVVTVRHLALQIMWEAASPAVSEALQLAMLDEAPEIRARAEELLRDTLVRESSQPGTSIRTVGSEIGPLVGTGSSGDLRATEISLTRKQPHMDIFMKAANRKVHSRRGTGVLMGDVTVGHLSPVEVSGVSRPPAPVPSARIIIFGLDGREIKSVRTDAHGKYSVRMSGGTYRIAMTPLAAGWFTKDLPATVTITEEQETRLDIHMDTGIR